MFGLASEFYKLSDADREALIEAAFDARVPDQTAIVSVMAHSREVARKQARRAEEAGADAPMLLPTFFLGPPGGAERSLREGRGRAAGTLDLSDYRWLRRLRWSAVDR